MKLIAYTFPGITPPDIRPASSKREWMDATPQSFAYRCLPLNIANAHGWDILCPCDFNAVWLGGDSKDAIIIKSDAPKHLWPLSHFGSGVLTFHVSVLFRTEPGFNLWVMGPSNAAKDGIAPLNGVIETDWAPYSFTMNWKFTREKQVVQFKKGEPFCSFFPVRRADIESADPEFLPIDSDPKTKSMYEQWNKDRAQFNQDLKIPQSEAQEQKWQKAYYRGLLPDGQEGCPEHQNKLRVKEFKKNHT